MKVDGQNIELTKCAKISYSFLVANKIRRQSKQIHLEMRPIEHTVQVKL